MRHILSALTLIVLMAGVAQAAPADGISAQDAFAKLQTLAGTWSGSAGGEGEEAEAEAETAGTVVHDFRVSAAGTVVMETMGPGSDHEMINMYHLDGEELVLTHYCAGGNQPTMRLDRDASSADEMVFVFTGGTNLDPDVDHHIHDAKISIGDDGIVSFWRSFGEGVETGTMTFTLTREME